MLKKFSILAFIALTLNYQSFADVDTKPITDNQTQQISNPPTISQIEQANKNILFSEKAMQAADNLVHDVKILVEIRFNDCLKAFGNNDFCNCIARKLPVAVSFIDYIQIITTDQDTLNKKVMQSNDPDAGTMVQKIQTTRETCVQLNQKK